MTRISRPVVFVPPRTAQTATTDRCSWASLDADWAPEHNPTERVAPGMPPVFIARGRLDHYSVPTRFVERAEAAGIEVVLREHPGAHGFENTSDPEQQAIVAEALAFVLEHLRARTP